MANSICEAYPGICEKSRLRYPRPTRLLRAANDNLLHGNRPSSDAPAPTTDVHDGDGSAAIRFGSAISILGLAVLTTYAEIRAVAEVFFGIFGSHLMDVPMMLR